VRDDHPSHARVVEQGSQPRAVVIHARCDLFD
jgi:hypothetical protein